MSMSREEFEKMDPDQKKLYTLSLTDPEKHILLQYLKFTMKVAQTMMDPDEFSLVQEIINDVESGLSSEISINFDKYSLETNRKAP